MKREYINLREMNLPLLSDGESSWVFRDGDYVIKIYKPGYLNMERFVGINTERKMLNSKNIELLPEIEVPISALYDVGTREFIGTRSRYIDGVNYNKFIKDSANNMDNDSIVKNHDVFEGILKRANDNSIVFPDFASCDNIIVTNGDRMNPSFKFIDYDGIQIGREKTMAISSSIISGGDPNRELIFSKKYIDSSMIFTKELNIYSAYVLFFLDILNTDITKIGQESCFGIITFDGLFELMGLDDYDLQHKIWKLFQQDEKNEFLGDDKYTIIDKYNIDVIGKFNNIDVKRLVRKK